jgi:hypothetical protein
MGSYFYFNVCTQPASSCESVGLFLLRHTGNDKDFLSTRVELPARPAGPAIERADGLLDVARRDPPGVPEPPGRRVRHGAGGRRRRSSCRIEPRLSLPEGEVLSPDGHCHAFDHRAQGTVFGSGAGVVVLRRLEDALDDGDTIHAVIRGTAVNNDGGQKVNYLAPSVDGQAACDGGGATRWPTRRPTPIGYVECHGTGTYLGDPIEISALTQAFRTFDAARTASAGSARSRPTSATSTRRRASRA